MILTDLEIYAQKEVLVIKLARNDVDLSRCLYWPRPIFGGQINEDVYCIYWMISRLESKTKQKHKKEKRKEKAQNPEVVLR